MDDNSPGENQGTSESNPMQNPAPPADVSHITEDSHEKRPSPPNPSNGSNNMVMWCGIVVLVAILVAGAVGITFALTGNDNERTERVVPITRDDPPPVTSAPSELVATMVPISLSPTRSPTMAPTATPTEETICPEELGEWWTCLQGLTSFDRSFCNECILDVLKTGSDTGSCSILTDQYCESIDSCNCQGCEDKAHVYFNCRLGYTGCLGDCLETETKPPTKAPVKPTRTAAPTFGNPCQPLVESYQTCLTTLTFAQVNECVDCANRVLQGTSNLSCEAYNSDYCIGFAECTSCGWCRDEITAWVDCQIDGDQCELDCSTVIIPETPVTSPVNSLPPTPIFNPQPTPRPTPRPTPAPDPTRCPAEREQYSTCLATNIASQDDRLACISCVNDASNNAPLDSCTSFESSLCSGLSQCTICNVCAELAISYIDCVVSDGQCQLDCGGGSEPPACTSEESAYQSCLPGLGSFRAQRCVDCYNSVLDGITASSCAGFNRQFCSAFNSCDCGSCDEVLVDWLDCRLTTCSVSC